MVGVPNAFVISHVKSQDWEFVREVCLREQENSGRIPGNRHLSCRAGDRTGELDVGDQVNLRSGTGPLEFVVDHAHVDSLFALGLNHSLVAQSRLSFSQAAQPFIESTLMNHLSASLSGGPHGRDERVGILPRQRRGRPHAGLYRPAASLPPGRLRADRFERGALVDRQPTVIIARNRKRIVNSFRLWVVTTTGNTGAAPDAAGNRESRPTDRWQMASSAARCRARSEMSPSSSDCNCQAMRLISQALFPAFVSSLKNFRVPQSQFANGHPLQRGDLFSGVHRHGTLLFSWISETVNRCGH